MPHHKCYTDRQLIKNDQQLEMYDSGNSPSRFSSKIQIMIQNSQDCLLYCDISLVDMR